MPRKKSLVTFRDETQKHMTNVVASRQALDKLGEYILKLYIDQLRQDGVTGSLLNSTSLWEQDGTVWKLYFMVPEYQIWEEYGRGPGKMPPSDVIEDWLRFKGKYLLPDVEDKDIPQISWAIRVNIGRHGTEGKHTLKHILDDHPEILEQVVSTIAEIEIDQSLVDELDESFFDV